MAEREIFSVTFEQGAVVISYIEVPTDVRVKGMAVQQHAMRLDRSHPDYDEDARKLHDRAEAMLLNALDDFRESPPYNPADDEQDDDEDSGLGMGRRR